MPDFLAEIIKRKKQEKGGFTPRRKLSDTLKQERMTLIAEIKRKSPSKGVLAVIDDPVALARSYYNGGASALSILTDEKGFGGRLDDLHRISQAIPEIPLLRKDFLIEPAQIAESVRYGASAVLLIVAVLGDQLSEMLEEARRMRVDALVEVHNENELRTALNAGAEIIGINNRDLKTFSIDLTVSEHLRKADSKQHHQSCGIRHPVRGRCGTHAAGRLRCGAHGRSFG